MKKKLLNAVSTLAIAAIVALNVHVVTSEQTPAFLKWDVVGKILAEDVSGSGSGSGSSGPYNKLVQCRYENAGSYYDGTQLKCLSDSGTSCTPTRCK